MAFLKYSQECLDAAQGKWPASGHGWGGVQFDEPVEKRPNRPKTIRVFQNGFIEAVFARAHPITPIVWFAPVIGYGVYAGVKARGALPAVGWFALGWLLWTLLEYALHRGIFHLGAKTPEQKFRAFMIHGYHHEFPNDKLRLVAPPLMSWPLAVVVGTLYYFSFGALVGPSVWWPVFAGTVTGYIAYDWIHYYAHHFKPSNPIGKWLKQYHLQHHFDGLNGSARYGVSNPLWDFVFRTYVPVKSAAAKREDGHGERAAG